MIYTLHSCTAFTRFFRASLLYRVCTFHVPTHMSIVLLSHYSWFYLAWISVAFVTVNFSRVELSTPHPTQNLEDQGLNFAWLLPFDLSGMGGATTILWSH
jgi:hypothetical protein